jgi:Glycosyl hydrolases family 43
MKKSFIIALITLCTTVSAQVTDSVYVFSYFKNNGKDGLHLAYSKDGLKWEALHNDESYLAPELGNEKLVRDPCIIYGADKKYHMVWTVGWTEKGIGYASSDDLVHWSPQKFIPVMEHEKDARNCWAPEITYDPVSKMYMIYWATTITGTFPETLAKGENSYNHRIYYTMTKDFKAFTKAALLFEPGFNVIDASIQVLGKEKYVMFYKDETVEPVAKKNINLAYAKSINGPYKAVSTPAITGNYWAEGPAPVKVDKEWVVYFDRYRDHKYGAVKSTDLKQWEEISDSISLPVGLRHGSIIKVPASVVDKLIKG